MNVPEAEVIMGGMFRSVSLIVLLCTGCVDAKLVDCGDGTTCPAGTTCVGADRGGCAKLEQLTACDGLADNSACTYSGFAGICDRGACVPCTDPAGCVPDVLTPGVYSSPGPAPSLFGGYPGPFSVTLAADDPATTIYYTTDGTAPTFDSTHAKTPITQIAITGSTTLTYYGTSDTGTSSTTVEMFDVVGSVQSKAAYVVTDTMLDQTSPVVLAAPDQGFAVTANIQVWVQSSCPSCSAQLVYGVDSTDQGCAFDGVPGAFPGQSFAASFTVTAPPTPGVHEVRVVHIEETSCAAAIAINALAVRPNMTRIAVLVVR